VGCGLVPAGGMENGGPGAPGVGAVEEAPSAFVIVGEGEEVAAGWGMVDEVCAFAVAGELENGFAIGEVF
jgi:hypothetical protein